MDIFETIIIFDKDASDLAECEAKFNKLFIQYSHENGKLAGSNHIGIKSLAYEVKGRSEGDYMSYLWAGTQDQVTEVERLMRINDTVLKFITIKTDEKDLPDYTEGKSEQDTASSAKANALDILIPVKNLTNDEKYDIIKGKKGVI